MPNYWVVAPLAASPSEDFDVVWNHDLRNKIISIGWEAIGPIEQMGFDALRKRVSQVYPNYVPSQATRVAKMLWQFHNEIEPGDWIIARRGRSTIEAVGKVTGRARFVTTDEGVRADGVDYDHSRVLPVDWDSSRNRIEFPEMMFGMQTIYPIDEVAFQKFLDGTPELEVAVEAEHPSNPVEFVLEKYLEEFIVSNFDGIFAGQLSLYRDPVENVVGQQFSTEVGVIDVLATDITTNDFVVIELKKGQAADRVVGQVLRYMGWIKTNLASEKQGVRGIVISKGSDKRLSYALSMVPNVSLKTYNVSFSLDDVAEPAPRQWPE